MNISGVFKYFHFVTLAMKLWNADHVECQTKVPIKSLFMVQFKKIKFYRKVEM